jgi:hypothetical protein
MNPEQTPKRKTEIASRRQQVAEMYLQGRSQAEIGEALSCDQATVSRDLTELRKEWLERSINHVDQKKAIELAKLDRLEVTYWNAWDRSQENAETEISRDTPLGHVHEHKSVGQSGNPAFLEGVLKCIQKRCELLGLDAPKKTDLTSGGKPIQAGSDERYDRAVSSLADALRDLIPGTGTETPGPVDAAKQTPVGGVSQPGG